MADSAKSPRRFQLRWPSWQKRKRMLVIEAWCLIGLSYPLMLFAEFWPPAFRRMSPCYVWTSWAAFMVQTFSFHIGLVVSAILVVAMAGRKWRLALAATALVLWTVGGQALSYLPKHPSSPTGETIRVMSVNLLMINKSTEPIISEIRLNEPDLLLLQEYTDDWHAALTATLADLYPYRAFERREDSFGAAIFSRRPFVQPVEMDLPLGQATEPQMRVIIELDGQPIAVYHAHLLPPWGLEYTTENRIQFADLLSLLAREESPAIVAGDFNFTNASPHARQLRRHGFVDAYDLAGWGRGTTWPNTGFFRWIPALRLDHIFLSRGLTCTQTTIGQGQGSDHRPVIARIGIVSNR